MRDAVVLWGAPPRTTTAERLTLAAVCATVFVVGVVPVVLDLSRPHGLYGVTQYDDGVYFAAALRVVEGIFPYRDFVFVQPPGITVVLAPFAALSHLIGGRSALGAARVLTALVAGANAALVTWLLRRRGLLAAAFGGLLLAVFPPAYAADHTFLLEPYCVLFCLIGLALVLRGDEFASNHRIFAGGIAFGFAGAVKVFAAVPILVVIVLVYIRRRRAAGAFALGVAAALVVFVLPFFLAAPGAFVHDVISSQLGRTTPRPTPLLDRLFSLLGLSYATPSLSVQTASGATEPAVPASAGPTVLAAALGAGVLLLGGLLPLLQRRARDLELVIMVAMLAVVGTTTFIPAAYYDHYALFSAAFLALAFGAVAGRATNAVRAATTRRGPERTVLRAALGTSAALCLALGTIGVLIFSTRDDRAIVDRFGDPGPSIAAEIPSGSCVLSDAETLLVSAGRAAPGPAGCPAIVDPTGTWLSVDPLHPPRQTDLGEKDPALVASWQAAFARADYVVLSGRCAFRIPWTPPLRSWFDAHYTELAGSYSLAFRRNGVSGPDALQAPADRIDLDIAKPCLLTHA